MGKTLIRYFLSGLVVIVPVAITVYLIYNLIIWADSLLGIPFTGMGIITVAAAITLLGFLASIFITKPIFNWADKTLQKIPFINLIYGSVKDVMDAFVGDKRKFSTPVAVKMSETGIMKLGFITQEAITLGDQIAAEKLQAVYFPHSYNFSGNLFLVPMKNIIPINRKPADVMKYIVSGGVIQMDDLAVQE